MKKLFLPALLCTLLFVGCASTKAEGTGNELPDTLIPPAMEKKLVASNASNPLKKTNVKGIYVAHPYKDMEGWMDSGYNYDIEILDKTTGDVLYTIHDVIVDWTGSEGWSGQITKKDLTFVTEDYLQYFVKENMFSWREVVEDGFVNATMPNDLVLTEIPYVYLVKPVQTKNILELINSDYAPYPIEVIERATNKTVMKIDNVVNDWYGISGWNNQIDKDYSLITKDKKQYIVNAKKYNLKYEISYYNPTDKDIDILTMTNQKVATVKAGTISTVKTAKNEDHYHYMDDGKKWIDVTASYGFHNFYLGRVIPEKGKKYLCLNQYKEAGIDKSGNLYGICLFEVVDETNEFAYKYSDDIYISNFPSASLWFDDEKFVKENIGKEIEYSRDFFKGYKINDDDYSWGWSTYKDNKPYNHIMFRSRILKK